MVKLDYTKLKISRKDSKVNLKMGKRRKCMGSWKSTQYQNLEHI
jgi:hypothetical protein